MCLGHHDGAHVVYSLHAMASIAQRMQQDYVIFKDGSILPCGTGLKSSADPAVPSYVANTSYYRQGVVTNTNYRCQVADRMKGFWPALTGHECAHEIGPVLAAQVGETGGNLITLLVNKRSSYDIVLQTTVCLNSCMQDACTVRTCIQDV